MTEHVRVTSVIAAEPETIYEAWLDAGGHSAMTGGAASSDPQVGGEYSAWEGYITGRYVELEPSKRIVARWRSTEFPADAPDSLIEVVLTEVPGGTEVELIHSELPEGHTATSESAWHEYYFEPMKKYFGSRMEEPEAEAAEPQATEPKPAKKAKPKKPAKIKAAEPEPAPEPKAAKKPAKKAAKTKAVAAAAKPAKKAVKAKPAKKAVKAKPAKAAKKPAKKAAKAKPAKAAKKPAKKAAKAKPAKAAKKPAKKRSKKR